MTDELLENSVNYVTEGVAEYVLTLFPQHLQECV